MKILIIEDELDNSLLLKRSFEYLSFVVDVAEDGEKGSYIARTNDYDIILLDNILPRKTGFQICRELRESGRTVPIIMLSVKSEIPDKVTLLENGADDYVTKPFSFKELLARIQAVLRRPPIVENNHLTVEDIVLDINKRQVSRGGKLIYLTRKQFLLLEYLLRHKGTVVSRGEIMEHVWNMDADPFSNTIEAHIRNLRNKIDTNRKHRLIKAVPGRGYKIDSKK